MPLDGIEAKFLEINACNVHEFSLQQVFDFIVTRQWARLQATALQYFPHSLYDRVSGWHCAAGELVREDHYEDRDYLTYHLSVGKPLGSLLRRFMYSHDNNNCARWPSCWRTIATKFGLNDYAVPEG